MIKRRTSAMALGVLSFVLAGPAFGQPDDEDRQRELRLQEQQALMELLQDLQLQQDGDEIDPGAGIEEQRRRVEEIHRRVMQIQQERRPQLIENQFPADPIQLDAKPVENPWAERPREEAIAALDHAEFTVRESAQAHLLTDTTLGQDTLKELIREAKSPEQGQRLLRLAEHHVMREIRERDFGHRPGDGPPIPQEIEPRPASVGYSYDAVLAHENPHAQLPGVKVVATMPGFPGYAHLRRGDIVVQINGRGPSLHHDERFITNWVTNQINERQAGQTIDFTVLRDGKPVAIKMVCAEAAALNEMYTTDAYSNASRLEPFQRAWEKARTELTAQMPKPKVLTPKTVEAGE